MHANWQDWLMMAAPWLWRGGLALVVLLIFWTASSLPDRLLQRLDGSASVGAPRTGRLEVLFLLGQLMRVGLMSIGILLALAALGVDVAGLVAGLGLTGLALGVAFKDVLANLISGALVLFYRPFQRGDYIQVTNLEGRVREVNFRYTILEGDGRRVLIPNSTLFTNSIIVEEK